MTVFLDANVIMYLTGADHPSRDRDHAVAGELVLSDTRLVTDTQVVHEMLHRYAPIARPDAVEPAYGLRHELADDVVPIGSVEIEAAEALVLDGIGARDALHVAATRSKEIRRIFTFDRGFDRFADLERAR